MTNCQKCGSGDVSKPRFGTNLWGREFLAYTCHRCGYRQEEQTLEQERSTAAKDCSQPKEGA